MAKKSSDENSSGIKFYLSNPWNLIKTGFLILTWIVLAFHLELVGPTMPILASNINVDYSGMGSALASRGAGYFVANILGVILQNIVKTHSYGLLVLAFILPAIAVFLTPFVKSLVLMCILFFAQGTAQGLTDLAGTNILLTMWGTHAAAPMNIVHLGYGIGAVLVNLIVRPFLTKNVLSTNVTDIQVLNSTLPSADPIKSKSNIIIPYFLTGILCVLIFVGHIYFYIRELKIGRQRLDVRQTDYAAVSTNSESISRSIDKEILSPYSPRTCGRGYFQYGLILSILFIFYIFFIGGNDQTFSKFFFAFLKSDKFNLSAGAASWGIILYWLSYSIGRLIGAISSVFLSVDMCLNIVWVEGLFLAIAWLIFVWVIGLTTTSLFILGAATGLVFAPIFPLSFGLFNKRLNVVPMLIALLLCGSALGAITFQKIAGFILDKNPNHFPTLLILCILMSILFYIAAYIVYYFHQRNNSLNARASITNGAALTPEILNEEEQEMANYFKDQEDK